MDIQKHSTGALVMFDAANFMERDEDGFLIWQNIKNIFHLLFDQTKLFYTL